MGGLDRDMEMSIGDICNYYGGLSVKSEDDKYFWSIYNYSGEDWEEIPKYLFDVLVKYENERQESECHE